MTPRELIRSVRRCKTSAEERALIAKESAAIRASLRDDEHFMRHRNVAKLMYMHMLGYPTHFGQMECVKLIATAGFPEKRVGYLGLMILLDERQEVTMLVTNSIKNDLGHKNHFIVGLALCALGNICTAEMARDVAPEVASLLGNRNSYVRKKAALCAIRVVNKVPELAESFLDGAERLLADRHHGVLLAAVTLILRLCDGGASSGGDASVVVRGKAGNGYSEDDENRSSASDRDVALARFRRRVPDLVKILRALLHGAYSAEHDVGGQYDPFLQVKLLRLLRVLGSGDAEASDAMSDALANVASNESKAGKNAGAAVLYEAVRCAVGVESVGGLRVLAVNVLGRFLADKDNNVRYVALNALAKVVSAAGGNDAQAVQRHRRTIVECVKDGDITIRRSALNLVYSLVNAGNVETLVPELLEYLAVADPEFKADVAKRIACLCAAFAPSDRWRVDAFVETLLKGGAHVARDECRSFLALITNRVDMQPYATRALYRAAHEARDDAHFPLAAVACWALGEYGDAAARTDNRLPDEPPTVLTVRDVVDTLKSVLADARAPRETRRVAMVALTKLAARFADLKHDSVAAVAAFQKSLDLEMQQRSVEFVKVFDSGNDAAAAALERMPPMALRDEVGAAASGAGAGAGGVAQTSAAASGADLLGDLLGPDGGGAQASAAASGADLLGDLLGPDAGGAQASAAASGADLLGGLLGDAGGGIVGGIGGVSGNTALFPSGGAPPTSADPLAELMGASPLASGVPPDLLAPGAAPDPLMDLMGGAGTAAPFAAGGSAPADPVAGLSATGLETDLLGPPTAPANAGAPAPGSGAAPALVVPALDAHGVNVRFSCAKPNDSDASATTITASYSNANAFAVTQFTLRAAVPKSMTLALEPASGGDIAAGGGVVTQVLNVVNPLVDSKSLAMRLQVTWREAGGEARAETATVTFPRGV